MPPAPRRLLSTASPPTSTPTPTHCLFNHTKHPQNHAAALRRPRPSMETLPQDTLKQIFRFLPAHSLLASEIVCRLWRDLASKDDAHWEVRHEGVREGESWLNRNLCALSSHAYLPLSLSLPSYVSSGTLQTGLRDIA